MPKICANLSMLFTEVDFLERFARAASAGFKGVEYLFPYPYPATRIAELLSTCGLKQVLFNLPAGDWSAGERGIAALPDRVNEFREGVDRAIDYAGVLGCTQCNALAGKLPAGVSQTQAEETFVENLRYAARKLKAAGIRLLAEAINTRDIPGFILNNTAQAMALFDRVGSDNLFYQYDIYHMQRMEGELANTIQKFLPRIAHLQLADNPGRHEPGSGEINYQYLFGFIDSIGYDGWIGAEYVPAAGTEAGLGWMKTHNVF